MTIVMRCVRGCPLPGQHLPGCADCYCQCHDGDVWGCGWGCQARHEDCTGCKTAPADYGLLCYRCHGLLCDLLGARESPEGPHGFAWIYDWLSENLDPITRPGGDTIRGGGDEAPVPIRLEVLDCQFLITETLRGWMEAAIESVPHACLSGPETMSAGSVTRWMLAHLTILETGSFAADLVSELDEMAGEAHRCAPWRPAPRILSGVVCPWCHVPALRIPGGEVDVRCGHCGACIDRQQYQMWARYLAEQCKPEARKRAAT
jgi:hypothetical protein